MNSKYAKMALPGLVMGLVLGLGVPAASFAQDRDHGDHDWHGGNGGSSHAGDRGGQGQGGQQRQAPPQGQGGQGQGGQRGNFVGARTQTGGPVNGGGNVQAHVGAGGQPGYRGDARGDWHGGDNRGGDWHGTPPGGGQRGDWHGAPPGGGGHFDWHGDSRFHDYSGVRVGFYFAPGRGYYHVPPQWYGHHWGRGEYLPRFFFSYRIYDPDYYDLPYPPYGCAWMFVGEDAVLVDLDTGQIIDVIYGVY